MNRLCMGCMKEYDDQFSVCPHCGYAFNTPPKQSYHIPPGSVLRQRYIVGKVLGFGGFGITYVGWDYVMERKVAIKEYLPSEFATRMPTQLKVTVYSGDREEQYREGLLKTLDEARRLAKFEAVPGIVQIYDCFEENGTSYIIMEFLEGTSLKEYLAEHGKMTPEQALPVVQQIAFAMEEVHKTGILHRDIAPDNIYVLNPDDPDHLQVKLLDFGAARYATTKHSKSLSVIIKPGYAPEEQYRSRGDQGTWTDVYALAATFYKMLTGVTPEDAMERSIKDEVKRPSRLGVKLTKSTETALMNALHVKVQDRTQTMEEFSKELIAAEVKERAVTKDRRDVGAVPKWVLALAGTGLAAVAVIAVLIFTGTIPAFLSSGEVIFGKNEARVPNVINRDVTEAETLLAEKELGMNREKANFSEEIPMDMISYQEYPESARVPKHTEVIVWVSKGPEKRVLPTVKGKTREEAQKLLEAAGFQNIRVEESTEEGVYDTILGVSEKEGDNVQLSKEIVITVCVNQENQEGDAGDQVEMPEAVGMTRAAAEKLLEEAGLRINWVEETSEAPEGQIIAQEIAAGEKVNRNSFVTITVSKGAEKIYMPYVKEMSQEEAVAELKKLGLRVETEEEYSDSAKAGQVIAQSIDPEAEVKKNDLVTLVISKGKDPAKQTRAAKETQPARTQAADEAARQAEEQRQAEAAAAEAARQAEAQRQAEAAAQQTTAAPADENRNPAFDMLN
ncbi:MAG: PASTA domain-containing protein [Eubacteriales bacterium]|nr:PASTA domain-containing protein [Eubacteriales bacterium]